MRIARAGLVTVAVVVSAACAVPSATPSSAVAPSTSAVSAASSTPSASVTASSTPSASVAGITPLATTARAVPSTLFGMHAVQYVNEPMPVNATGSWRLWDSGTMWANLQPVKGRAPNFKPIDDKVAAGKAAGVTDFLIVIGLPPKWAASNPSSLSPYYPGISISPPASMAEFQAYVTALARHVNTLRGTTWSFEVWNEADLGDFYSGTPERLATMSAYMHRAVKGVNPRFTTVAASLTVRRGIGDFFYRYMAGLRTAKGFNGRTWPVDVFSVHPYPSGSGTPYDTIKNIRSFRESLGYANAPSRPLWNTEINYGLPGPGTIPRRDIRGVTAAAYLARTYLDALRMDVARVYWYAWMPQTTYLGIVTMPGTRATNALTTLSGWLRGTTYTGCTGAVLHVCRFTKGTTSFRIAWTDTGTSSMALTRRTRVCAISGIPGGTCATTSAKSLTVGTTPVRLS